MGIDQRSIPHHQYFVEFEISGSDRICPTNDGRLAGMKIRHLIETQGMAEGEVIAKFGQAALIHRLDGKWKLRGGSDSDRSDAQEWISLFLHEAVVEAV